MRAIRNRAERMGIEERIEFRPFVSSREALARLYREASCVVQPGPHETFGLVAFEAAASGTRAVACETTPSAYVAAPLVETFEPENPAELLAAIERARSAEPDLAAAASLAERYTWESVFMAELDDLSTVHRSHEEGRREGAGH
jgi:alpha-1,6-mannosyltransferase